MASRIKYRRIWLGYPWAHGAIGGPDHPTVGRRYQSEGRIGYGYTGPEIIARGADCRLKARTALLHFLKETPYMKHLLALLFVISLAAPGLAAAEVLGQLKTK